MTERPRIRIGDDPVPTPPPGPSRERLRTSLHIVGRRQDNDPRCLAYLGRQRAPDGSLGSEIRLDVAGPHVVVICGKRGYGKSYTMGVLLEELSQLERSVRDRVVTLVLDTLGVFWTMAHPARGAKEALASARVEASGFDVRVFAPRNAVERFRKQGIDAIPIVFPAHELRAEDVCEFFGIGFATPVGLALARALNGMPEEGWGLDDLEAHVHAAGMRPEVQDMVLGIVAKIREWDLFDRNGTPARELLTTRHVNVIDLSPLREETLKVLVASVVGRRLFEYRVAAKKAEDTAAIRGERREDDPLVWLAIDEAQVFLPAERETPAKDVFIRGWMRQGRQPGLSLILATQRLSAMEKEVLSHADVFVAHRVTAAEDLAMLDTVDPGLAQAVVDMGTARGAALIVDKVNEKRHPAQIRPRQSLHGGDEPNLLR